MSVEKCPLTSGCEPPRYGWPTGPRLGFAVRKGRATIVELHDENISSTHTGEPPERP